MLKRLHRKLDQWQRGLWFKIIASVLAVGFCAGYFGAIVSRHHSINEHREELYNALAGQNDENVTHLLQTGEVKLNSGTYGGPEFITAAKRVKSDSDLRALVNRMLVHEWPGWAPGWLVQQSDTARVLAVAFSLWFLLIIWIELSWPFLITLAGMAIPVGVGWWAGSMQTVLTVGGMGLLAFTYVVLVRGALLAFSPAHRILAVAHTVVKEASRTKLGLVFMTILVVTLPMLPFWLDGEDPLRYRMQTFISRSMGLTFFMAACMTLFLSTATVSFEIRDRQIWQVMTKPVGRLNYLLGKWLGVMTMNLIILIVAGVSIFTFIQYLSETSAATDARDRLAVTDEILSARIPSIPEYEALTSEQVRGQVDQKIESERTLLESGVGRRKVRQRLARELSNLHTARQRHVLPFDPQGRVRPKSYVFKGLQTAKSMGAALTFRYVFHILADDEHREFPVAFVFNDDPETTIELKYVPTLTYSRPIPPSLIQEDGTLKITVVNLHKPPPGESGLGALNWDLNDFQILYKVASFEGNFFRAVLVMWMKLAFLAALGIGCATFLSFPVACLFAFTVFASGTIGPFLAASLTTYYPPSGADMDWGNIALVIQWVFQSIIRGVAQGLVYVLRGFGDLRPTQALVEGRFIGWWQVGTGFIKLTLFWSGLALAAGYFVIRNRQLAIYSGQGS